MVGSGVRAIVRAPLQQPACRRIAALELVEIQPVFAIVLRFPEPVPTGLAVSWM